MDTEQMRQEFDEWFANNIVIGFRCEEIAAWAAWQASRESLVVELPKENDIGHITYTSAIRAIERQGITVK